MEQHYMPNPQKIPYDVIVRRLTTGEQHARLIFAADESTARERAMVRARHALGATMVERLYGEFEVLSCKRQAP
jgi:hypothetical protein